MKRKDLLDQVKALQAQLEQARRELAEETVEASAGGGAVRVVMSGTQECKAVHIEEALVKDGDVDMLQDLVLLAVNQAIHDSQALAARKLGPLGGGLAGLGSGG